MSEKDKAALITAIGKLGNNVLLAGLLALFVYLNFVVAERSREQLKESMDQLRKATEAQTQAITGFRSDVKKAIDVYTGG